MMKIGELALIIETRQVKLDALVDKPQRTLC